MNISNECDWIEMATQRYSETAISRMDAFTARSLMGNVQIGTDGDVPVIDFETGNINEAARRNLIQLLEKLPLCFISDLSSLLYFQAVAEKAGGFITTNLGNVGCADERRFSELAEEEINAFEKMATRLDIHPIVIAERAALLRGYFSTDLE